MQIVSFSVELRCIQYIFMVQIHTPMQMYAVEVKVIHFIHLLAWKVEKIHYQCPVSACLVSIISVSVAT